MEAATSSEIITLCHGDTNVAFDKFAVWKDAGSDNNTIATLSYDVNHSHVSNELRHVQDLKPSVDVDVMDSYLSDEEALRDALK